MGVEIAPESLAVVHVMHRRATDERIDFFLTVRLWTGDIVNREPDKCDELLWCSLASLPDNTIPYIRRALRHYQQGIPFSELGWSPSIADDL